MNKEDKLRLTILRHFREARLSMGLTEDEVFAEFDPEVVRDMIRAMVKSGLLQRVRGTTTDTVYMLTQMGVQMMNNMEEQNG